MIDAGTARRSTPHAAREAGAALAVSALVFVGYLAVADVRISLLVLGGLAVAAWALFAFQHPRAALGLSFPMLLIAGTKFRVRDATASLDGALDAQVVMELGLFGIVGIGALAAWLASRERWRPTRADTVLAAYVMVALCSAAWSESPVLTIVRAGQLGVLAVVALLAVRILSAERAMRTAAAAVTLHVLAFSALVIVMPSTYGVLDSERPGRFSWVAVHPIEVGTLAAIGAVGLMAMAMFAPHRREWRRLLGLPLPLWIVPTVGVLVLANTRGALLAFAAAAGLLLFLRMHATVRWPLALLAAAAVPVALVVAPDVESWLGTLASDYPMLDALFFRGQGAQTVLEMNGRLELWSDVGSAVVEHIVGGYGYLASRNVLLDAAPWAAYAHNALLQSLLDLGVVGTLALLAVVLLALSAIRRTDLTPWLRVAVTTVAVFLVVNSVSTESFAGAPGFDALVLFLCAACAASPAATERGARR